MKFDRFFRIISFSVIFCGFLTLSVAGGLNLIQVVLFIFVLIAGWLLENSNWQISQRFGTVSIFIIIPVFYIAGKYDTTEFGTSTSELATTLAKMILLLIGIKLLQKKTDRDWLFLYLMAFFEVLLAAGLSISLFYLGSLILYLLLTICAIVTFEIRKTSRLINQKGKRNKNEKSKVNSLRVPITYLLAIAIAMFILIVAFALPMFFLLPRVGGASLGGNLNGLSNITGFSDSVTLGEIGRLLQSDQIIMRARVDKANGHNQDSSYWRGVALDTFDNRRWTKLKKEYHEPFVKGQRDFFLIDYVSNQSDLTIQTVYLEAIDTPTLFTLSRPVAVQGNFQVIKKDSEGAIVFQRTGFERISYKVYSDTFIPSASELKFDNGNYSPDAERYLQLPEKMDKRIGALAKQITEKYSNRFERAKAVENYLQTQFGYSLEMNAKGDEPLADFLFNVRKGHCEYFASAMAIMLRTQGIATRIVNGFHQGEYNETANVFIIKQKDAHSWVEVYFPKEDAWIPFDPTPAAGQDINAGQSGITGNFNRYLEALETFWIQYFVSYDDQEQHSLMRSVKTGIADYQTEITAWLNEIGYKLASWWSEARGDRGLQTSARAVALGIGYLLATIFGIISIVWLFRKIKRLGICKRFYGWLKHRNETTIVEFYERMQKVLASKGFTRPMDQTPLEFAFALNMPEAVSITEKYNRVRFGEKNLSKDEAIEIENWLKNLSEDKS